MNSQRNSVRDQNFETLPKFQKSGKTPSPSRRKKIFAQDQSEALVSSKGKDLENAQKKAIVEEIYKTIENINQKLQDCSALQHENKTLKTQNSKLRSLIDENAQINILKRQKAELQGKLFDYKKRLQKARLLVEVLFAQQKNKNKKELLQFQSIFDI